MDNNFEETRSFWGKEVVRGNLTWPDEHVIRFVKRNVQPGGKILDFGAGAGRNTIALAQEGYECVAMDYSDKALEFIKGKIAGKGYKVSLVQNDGLNVPLPSESIDAIVADRSLFSLPLEDTEELLKNLKKCLKTNGLMWADWRTNRDWLMQHGKELSRNFYELGEGTGREGAGYFFADRDILREIYNAGGWDIQSIDTFEYTVNNGEKLWSWFHVISKRQG